MLYLHTKVAFILRFLETEPAAKCETKQDEIRYIARDLVNTMTKILHNRMANAHVAEVTQGSAKQALRAILLLKARCLDAELLKSLNELSDVLLDLAA